MSPAPGRHAHETSGSGDETLILAEVHRLLDQLGLRAGRNLTLDSDLTTDLGVDSLALIELFDHLESTFGVTLDDDVLMSANTPRHWLDAVRAARGEVVFEPDPGAGQLTQAPKQPWPEDAATLLDALAWHVEHHPAQICLRLIGLGDGGSDLDVTYQDLDRDARVMADALLGRGLARGERVALMLPSGREYFAVFLGALLAGGVPVPIYPPAQMAVLEAHLQRQRHLLDNAGATILVTVPEAMVAARLVARAGVVSARGRDRASPPRRPAPGPPAARRGRRRRRVDPVHLRQHRRPQGRRPHAPPDHDQRRRHGPRGVHGQLRRRRHLAPPVPRHGPHRVLAHPARLRRPGGRVLSPRLPRPPRVVAGRDLGQRRHDLGRTQLRLPGVRGPRERR